MNDFDYENLQKKRIAAGAFHKKNGGKSRGCTLPSDHLTEAERRKLNGPVTTIRLDEPMEYKAFKRLSDEQKKMYLARLEELYHPSQQMLGDMFGVSAVAVCKALKKLGVRTSYGQKDGRKPTAEQHAMWEAFCGGVVGGKPAAPAAEEERDDVPVITEEPPLETEIGAEEDVTPAAITRLDITYAHVHSWEELYALLQRFGPIGDKTVRVIVE